MFWTCAVVVESACVVVCASLGNSLLDGLTIVSDMLEIVPCATSVIDTDDVLSTEELVPEMLDVLSTEEELVPPMLDVLSTEEVLRNKSGIGTCAHAYRNQAHSPPLC